MLHYLSNIMSNGLRSLKQEIVNRCKLFSPWDYTLLATSVMMPSLLGQSTPLLMTGAIGATLGALLLLPRGGSSPNSIPDSIHTPRVMRIIQEIGDEAKANQKPLDTPDFVILNNPQSTHISAEAIITRENKNILKISGDLTKLTDGELEMLIAHELAHFHFQDHIAQDRIGMVFWASMILALARLEERFLLTMAYGLIQFLISQAGSRYREYRADHYATLNKEEDAKGEPHKIKNLHDLINILSKEMGITPAVPAAGNFIDGSYRYLLQSYHHPNTTQDRLVNSCLNLLSSHPTPLFRIQK